jgi:hypothetical protein
MERRRFAREFKLETVKLIRERGVSYAQASASTWWPRAVRAETKIAPLGQSAETDLRKRRLAIKDAIAKAPSDHQLQNSDFLLGRGVKKISRLLRVPIAEPLRADLRQSAGFTNDTCAVYLNRKVGRDNTVPHRALRLPPALSWQVRLAQVRGGEQLAGPCSRGSQKLYGGDSATIRPPHT